MRIMLNNDNNLTTRTNKLARRKFADNLRANSHSCLIDRLTINSNAISKSKQLILKRSQKTLKNKLNSSPNTNYQQLRESNTSDCHYRKFSSPIIETSLCKLQKEDQLLIKPAIQYSETTQMYPVFSHVSQLARATKMIHIYLLPVLLVGVLLALQGAVADGSIESNLKKYNINPDIVPSNIDILRVEIRNKELKPGDLVPAKNFQDFIQAKFSWGESRNDRYTLLLIDLDRGVKNKSQTPTITGYAQFLSVNIPGNSLSAGQAVLAFDPPSVECEPGKTHRLLLLSLLQKQSVDLIQFVPLAAPSGPSKKRENVDVEKIIKEHDLQVVAANIFLAQGETNGVCSGVESIYGIGVASTLLISSIATIVALQSKVQNGRFF